MRVLIGVDDLEGAKELVGWVERFGFDDLTQEWMHVVSSQAGTVWSLDPIIGANRAEQLEEQLAGKMSRSLTELAAPYGDSVKVRVRIGSAAKELLNRADETKAALIAVRGSNKGGIVAFFLGSVARALVEGAEQSVLLTRGPAPQAPLKLLVLTDHSEYLNNALAALTHGAPKGIGALTLLHVSPVASPLADQATATAAKQLGDALGLPAEAVSHRIAVGPVTEAIDTALAETNADVLVLGAKGQTLLERLTLGSVSFRAVTTCPKTVLVLRV